MDSGRTYLDQVCQETQSLHNSLSVHSLTVKGIFN